MRRPAAAAGASSQNGSWVQSVIETPRVHAWMETLTKWFPVGVTSLEVPLGVPDLSFATFLPRGRLWVGLRYTDREHDTIDFGAAAVNVDDGRVVYYRQRPKGASSSKVSTAAFLLPERSTLVAPGFFEP